MGGRHAGLVYDLPSYYDLSTVTEGSILSFFRQLCSRGDPSPCSIYLLPTADRRGGRAHDRRKLGRGLSAIHTGLQTHDGLPPEAVAGFDIPPLDVQKEEAFIARFATAEELCRLMHTAAEFALAYEEMFFDSVYTGK